MRDTDTDSERYGGPISPGSLMTLLRACLRDGYDHLIPHEVFDVEKMAREINGWMTPVPGTAALIGEPLGTDFERVWDENAERLYEQ